MGVIRQCIRGCGTLPHVGEHPGTVPVLTLIGITGLAGMKGGVVGFLLFTAVGIAVYGPMYLYGAYDRARISDRLEHRALQLKGEA